MSHKVTIELEFEAQNGDSDEEQTVMDCDVYDYLEDLIADGTLDYRVTAATGYTYGKIEADDPTRHPHTIRIRQGVYRSPPTPMV